jgi:hypothetical protein
MAKAEKVKIKKAKQPTELPLDDMRWRPLAEIGERLFPHVGNKTLIAHYLTEAVARAKIRSKRHYTGEHTLNIEKLTNAELNAIANEKVEVGHHQPAGHGELVPASFWVDYYLAYSSNGDIGVAFRLPSNHHGPSGPSFTFTDDWAFYLWEPDCVKVWPALAPHVREADASEADGREPLRRKPGPRAKEEWQLFVAIKWCTLKYSGKALPTAGELAQLCQDELGYQPAETAINKLLRDLQRLFG